MYTMKWQLVINTLSFELHTEIYDGYGDMETAERRFTIDRKSRVLTVTDFQAESGEQSATLEGGQMAKLLRYIVHTLAIFMWEQDYCLNPDENDFFTNILSEEDIYVDDLEKKEEVLQRNRRTDHFGRCGWNTVITLCRIFPVMMITCQSVRKNCISFYWSFLNQKMKIFDLLT